MGFFTRAAMDALMKTTHPEINRRQCWNLHPHRKSCTACKDICPYGDQIFTRPNLVKDWDPCTDCGLCVSVCRSRCISPSPEQVEQLLRGIAGVSVVSVCASPEGETRAEISAGYDCREAGFRAFAQADCPLLTLHPRAGTLEEAFLELTDEDDAVAARALARLHRADTAAQDKEVPV